MFYFSRHYIILLPLILMLDSCAFRRITRSKNITYTQRESAGELSPQSLNIFAPHRHKGDKPKDVLVFIHGGNWTSGKKSLYNWLGSRLARKGIVTVTIDYPKSPAADYRAMAGHVAQSVKWVHAHIADCGGSPGRIFISGHSAGGHLAALISVKDSFLKSAGMDRLIKGVILIDAAGLDIYGYLTDGGIGDNPSYAQTFSTDPVIWKEATPLYHLHKGIPPMLIFRGGRTYPSIAQSNEKFVAALKDLDEQPVYIIQPRRKHILMITQFFNTGNPRYKDLLQFIQHTR